MSDGGGQGRARMHRDFLLYMYFYIVQIFLQKLCSYALFCTVKNTKLIKGMSLGFVEQKEEDIPGDKHLSESMLKGRKVQGAGQQTSGGSVGGM